LTIKPLMFAAAVLIAGAFHQPVLASDPLRPVKLGTVEAKADIVTRKFFGQVVAKQTVDLAFQVNGQILKFPVVEGNMVAKDGLLAQLDLEPFELALEQARLQLEQAERDLDRKKRLGPGTVSQVTIDDAETAARLARVAVRNAQYSLDQATLKAPFDALIATRSVEAFSSVSAGKAVARVHDMSELRVEIDVPEILFRQARDGRGVELFAVIPESKSQIPLDFREFNAETSTVGQTYAITLGMAPPEDNTLLPGASVTVLARRQVDGSKIVLPATAIVIAPDESTHVMQFEPQGADEGVLRKVAVEIETDDNGQFVLKSGIDAGAEIVVAGASAVSDGRRVRRFNGL